MKQIKDNINKAGLANYTDILIDKLRPTLYLIKDTADNTANAQKDKAIGSTRIGGRPDVPASFDWAVDARSYKHSDKHSGKHSSKANTDDLLSFFMQINLADIPSDFHRHLDYVLPKTGLLSVFVGTDDYLPTCRLFWFADITVCQPRDIPQDNGNDYFTEPLISQRLSVQMALALPAWYSESYDHLLEHMHDKGMSETQIEDYEHLVYLIEPQGEIIARMFGYYCGIGYDPIEDLVDDGIIDKQTKQTASDTEQDRWRHFLTIDSNARLGLSIGDAGYLQCLIKQADLIEFNLDNVYAAMQSS